MKLTIYQGFVGTLGVDLIHPPTLCAGLAPCDAATLARRVGHPPIPEVRGGRPAQRGPRHRVEGPQEFRVRNSCPRGKMCVMMYYFLYTS